MAKAIEPQTEVESRRLGNAVRWFSDQCELVGMSKDKHYWNIDIVFRGRGLTLTVTVSGDKEPAVIDGVSAAWALASRYRRYDYGTHCNNWMGEQKFIDNHYRGDDMANAMWERMQDVGKVSCEVFGDFFGCQLSELGEEWDGV